MPITFDYLKKKLHELEETLNLDSEPTVLKEKIIQAYYKKVLIALNDIFDEHEHSSPDLMKQCEAFLSKNWASINLSLLAYTALPDSPITHFLCKLAEFISEADEYHDRNTPPKPVISLLMPTINTESAHNDYQDLEPYWCDDEKCWVDRDPIAILNTHILGRDGSYLIPLDRLCAIKDVMHPKPLNNVYFDYAKHDDVLCFLDETEVDRLFKHSILSMSAYNMTRELNLLMMNDSSLLGHLNLLILNLSYNSTDGVGEELQAGEGVYEAILNFSNYYASLARKEKQKIPAPVHQEIKKLLDLCSDKKHIGTIATCIAQRRKSLESTIRPNEKILINIAINSRRKAQFILDAKQQRKKYIADFKNALAEGTYTNGHDKLGLNQQLLSQLRVRLDFKEFNDLLLLTDLSPIEISEILEIIELKLKIISVIKTTENLIVLCSHFTPEQLASFLMPIKKALFERYIYSPGRFSTLLINMDLDHCKLLCEVFKDNIIDTLRKRRYYKYENIANKLPREKHAVFYDCFKPHFIEFIKSVDSFSTLYKALTPSQQEEIFDNFKDSLPDLVKSGNNFTKLFKALTPSQQEEVFDNFKDSLPDLIKSGDNFTRLFNLLNTNQRQELYQSLEDNLFSCIITSAEDLARILLYLNDKKIRATIYTLALPKIPSIIQSARDFSGVYCTLNISEQNEYFEVIESQLPRLINTPTDFAYAMIGLSPKHTKYIYEQLNDPVSSIQDFIELYGHRDLKRRHRAAIYSLYNSKLPSLLSSEKDLVLLLQCLDDKDLEDACTRYKKIYTQRYVNSLDNFLLLLNQKKEHRTGIIFTMCKKKLKDVIHSKEELQKLLECPYQLPPTVYPLFSDLLVELIPSSDDLAELLKKIDYKSGLIAHLYKNNILPRIIHSGEDFAKIFNAIIPWSGANLRPLLNVLPIKNVLRTVKDISAMLNSIKDSRCPMICDELDEHLLSIITSGEKLATLLNELKQNCHPYIFSLIKNHLIDLIQSKEDFNYLKDSFEIDAFKALIEEELIAKLDNYIDQLNNQSNTLNFFNQRNSKSTKIQAALTLKDALNNKAVDLSPHINCFKQGYLGKLFVFMIKNGIADYLCDRQINTVSAFVETLNDINNPVMDKEESLTMVNDLY